MCVQGIAKDRYGGRRGCGGEREDVKTGAVERERDRSSGNREKQQWKQREEQKQWKERERSSGEERKGRSIPASHPSASVLTLNSSPSHPSFLPVPTGMVRVQPVHSDTILSIHSLTDLIIG